MIDRDDRELGTVALHLDRNGGLIKRSVDIVHRDRVMRIRSIAADIADNAQLPILALQALQVDEGGNGLAEVDAVYEDVALDDLRIGAGALRCLCQIPLLDL